MLGIDEIKKILPHREPFLMVDRVDVLESGIMAKGIKAISGNEWFFIGHFAETKIMPGVLIIEAIAQMGGIALLTMEEMKGKLAFLGKIKNARFHEKVVPGDILDLETTIDVVKGTVGTGKGKAFVRGKQVASCELVFAIGDDPSTI
ncbi:MAG: 3-hydroxyacyl-ACP dehydratase FabZ [Christensenellales bacterium]|jgi:3-hydroxyacyl-[acyl-carrier-protein] dehydratase